MPDPSGIDGVRIFIVEDDYYQATDMARILRGAGATVGGPFPSAALAEEAFRLEPCALAMLDLQVKDGLTLGLARLMLQHHVPFIFVTSAGCETLPQEFTDVPCLDKPLEGVLLVRTLARALLGKAPAHSN